MSSVGFRTALSALTSARQALQIIGHNVSNAATPGYSRQVINLRSRPPTPGVDGLSTGTGVRVAGIDRVADALLEGRIRRQSGELGRHLVLRDHLSELEALYAEPDEGAISGTMSAFFAELSGLAATPEDLAVRSGVVEKGQSLADSFRLLRGQLGDVSLNIQDQMRTEVEGINQNLVELDEINAAIRSATLAGQVPPDLLDRQQQVLEELGTRVDVRVTRSERGEVTVASGGHVLLSRSGAKELAVESPEGPAGAPLVRVGRASQGLDARGGRLQALQEIAGGGMQDRIGALDRLARNLIFEMNRVHSTGVPLEGGFRQLVSTNRFQDTDGDGSVLDEALQGAGLPFEVSEGHLYVNVTDEGDGTVSRTRLDIDPLRMTVGDLRDALNSVPELTAVVDPAGALRLSASNGHRFDFSNRLQDNPDEGRTFGASQATVTGQTGPYNLSSGDTFTVAVDGGAAQTVTFSPGQFFNIAVATPQEVAAAINSQVTGATAEVVDGRVVLRSDSSGTGSGLTLTDGAGSPLATMGLAAGTFSGNDQDARVTLGGRYTGSEDRTLVFEAASSGTIGLDPVQVDVRDGQGSLITTLDLGPGYTPGDDIEVVDGVSVSFMSGTISQGAGDRFEVDLVADSDTSDVLAATGLNAFFTGHDASTIDVSQAVAENPGLLAGGRGGGPGDNANILAMQEIQDAPAAGLGDLSVQRFYERQVIDLGVEASRADSTLRTQEQVINALQARREQISGVNLDEELLNMEQFQQSYQAAARFLQTLQEVNDILANLVG